MKHVKLEYDEATYALIREAAYQSRQPIKRYCQQVVAEAAAKLGVAVPAPEPTKEPATDSNVL